MKFKMAAICILNCDDAKTWSPVDFADMFHSFACTSNDSCILWNIASLGELPPTIDSCTAVIITGSRFNCRDMTEISWFHALRSFIQKAASTGSPRIYGGCFGCQIIAHALGGQVHYNPKENFILKAETVQLNTKAFWKYLSFKAEETLEEKSTLYLLESHRDCVTELPPDAELLASSSSCINEIFIAGANRNILACQSHPEFDIQYSVHDRIWPYVVETLHRLSEEEIAEAKASFREYDGNDALLFHQVIAAFLHK